MMPAQKPCLKPWWKLRTAKSSFFTADASTFSSNALQHGRRGIAALRRASKAVSAASIPVLIAEMDALEAHRVQEARGLADQQQAVGVRARNGSTSRLR